MKWEPQHFEVVEEEDEEVWEQARQPDNKWELLKQLDKPLSAYCDQKSELDDQGRLFCVTSSPTSDASMSPGSSQGSRPTLQLNGVTLDSSSDDVSIASVRCLQRHRKDLSMDSGIQGSSFDLADTSNSDSDENSHRTRLEKVEPRDVHHGETFNLVEEVYVVEDARGDLVVSSLTHPAVDSTADTTTQTEQVAEQNRHFVVVAIDFGTTYSGYAFCFTRDPELNIHMMRKWEGGDPGLNNQKTPTTLLLTPEQEFHSFGFAARDFFHDLDIQEAKKWLYFDKFKMALHHDQDMNRNTKVRAANGHALPAFTVFAHALRHLKSQALQELSDQAGTDLSPDDIRWVITVPAIWRQPAKQFIREAAYQAGVCNPDHPEGLLIALEPEAASICCRKLRLNQLIPERSSEQGRRTPSTPGSTSSLPMLDAAASGLVFEEAKEGTRYMVVDCGGGTVDITVHELSENKGTLRELHKATGGPWGSMGVDEEFEHLLGDIFGDDFLNQFKLKRPAAYVELMVSFEARKRSTSPHRDSPLNIFPPFAFIDFYRKFKGKEIEQAVRKYGRKDITWSSQGTLRLQPNVMRELFKPTLGKIIQYIRDVLDSPRVHGIQFLFLVGGFAESQLLQNEVRQAFSDRLRVIIPQGVSLTILRGAVLFGLDPGVVTLRRSKHTYGVGVLTRFVPGVHPKEKLVEKDGVQWCADVLDKFVEAEQSVTLGETVVRRYTPAKPSQTSIVINIYCADTNEAKFITDPGVRRCGTLNLDLSNTTVQSEGRREIHTRMVFGGTEVTASALDVTSGNIVHADVDFLTIQ
ncbi:heat shock 70 kDa protein 12A isoform X2 [Anabrus simplex]|uniref:heat shock 70 kDa protein 12A isoform X2 n=1 Tax=Anabrus simplex TaxID=316456 RepID=UPI0035A29DC2